jgi:hypothetical protein
LSGALPIDLYSLKRQHGATVYDGAFAETLGAAVTA